MPPAIRDAPDNGFPRFRRCDPMSLGRILIIGLSCWLPCAGEWTSAQKEWALGTSAFLTKLNGHRYDLLAGIDDPEKLQGIKSILEAPWGIHSRQDLIETIDDLLGDVGT